jgi:hypothetical protein
MHTTMSFDVGVIVTAIMAGIAPTIAIVAAAWVASRKLSGIHSLVNAQYTNEKRGRLRVMRALKLSLQRNDIRTLEEEEELRAITKDIRALEDEIDKRDHTEALLRGVRE